MKKWVIDSYALSWDFFLLLICLFQLQCDGFFFNLTIFYYCDLLKHSFFPIRDREWNSMGREVRGCVRSRGKGKRTQDILYEKRISL